MIYYNLEFFVELKVMFVKLLNYKIYSQSGTISFRKPTMVMIHGLGAGYANWVYQVRHLKERYDLLLIELPSHGKSKVMMSELEPNSQVVCDKVLELLDHLGIQRATFVGVSLGTLIVKNIALTHPEKIEKYILIGPVGKVTLLLRAAVRLAVGLMPIAPLKVVLSLGCMVILPYKHSAYARDTFLACAQRMEPKEFLAWSKVLLSFQKTQEEYVKAMKDEPDGLYIIGELDHFFLTMQKSDLKRLKNVVIVENAGHLCNMDQYEVVNDLIIAFQETGAVKKKELATAGS
jgi:pimeloyl-ACP methyl ester carboxylesterase